jgi:SP family general alpha glucoside:H+ symporter-like MFS transporter
LIIGISFAPESPWLLVRKGKIDQARKALLRLTSPKRNPTFNVEQTLAMMQHTTELERELTTGASYWDCFRGANLRRTEVVCMAWAMQNLSGNSFTGYTTWVSSAFSHSHCVMTESGILYRYFLQQAGLSVNASYSITIGQYAINCIGVFGSWFLMSRGIGRRSLYLYGLMGLFTMLLIIGCLHFVPASHATAAANATGGMMLGWATFYQLTVGTVCYSLVGEIPSRRLLIKTVALGRNA